MKASKSERDLRGLSNRSMSTRSITHSVGFFWTYVFKRLLRTAPVVLFLVVASIPYSFAQCNNCASPDAANILGVHNDGGRGCAGCHAPHSGGFLGSETGDSETREVAPGVALWGSANPSYGEMVRLSDTENYVEVPPARVASPSEDVIGILLCLSCHDGNLTPQTMTSGQSYARRMGFLGKPGRQPIPSLLADDMPASNNVEHPLGPDATITLSDGLVFANGAFGVIPGSPYARFMANYGLPVLAPGKRFPPYGGVNGAGQPYLLCTTCHNQHLMTTYPSTTTSPIAGDGGGRSYGTNFFANGPYNSEFDKVPGNRAPSTAQFCRQCHMDLANEGNNTLNIPTAFN